MKKTLIVMLCTLFTLSVTIFAQKENQPLADEKGDETKSSKKNEC